MTLDLKSAALEFTRKHSCPPAFIIHEAMKVGAAIAIGETAKDLGTMNVEMERHRMEIERGTRHGHSNGSLEI